MITNQLLRTVVLLAMPICLAGTLWANPNQTDPQAPLDVVDVDAAGAMVAACEKLARKSAKEMDGYMKAYEENKLSTSKMKAIGLTNVSLRELLRFAHRLRVMGEPAGEDFRLRVQVFRDPMNQIIGAYRGDQRAQLVINNIRRTIASMAKARERERVAIQRLVEDQKWAQAEDKLYALYDRLKSSTCYLTIPEQTQIFEPFVPSQRLIDQAMERIRREEAATRLAARRDELAPGYDALVSSLGEAARAVGQTGQAELDGASLSGPQLIEAFGQQWKQVQLAALRCRALEWARCTALDQFPTPELEEIESRHAAFVKSINQRLAALVQADAARVGPEQAAELHGQYLQALAPLAAYTADRQLAQAVDGPLQALAARSPAFGKEVGYYRAATDELLRWRRRSAEAEAARRAAEFPRLEQRLVAATRSTNEYRGLYRQPNQPGTGLAELVGSAPEILSMADERLLDNNVTIADVIGLPGARKSGIGRFYARTYTTVPLADVIAKAADAVTALQSELLVDPQNPPLSLAATMAILTAQRGDMAAIGGQIKGMYVEGLLTRFANLPDAAWTLVPLGPFPNEAMSAETGGIAAVTPIMQAAVRFDVVPSWARHEYFVVDLQPAEAGP